MRSAVVVPYSDYLAAVWTIRCYHCYAECGCCTLIGLPGSTMNNKVLSLLCGVQLLYRIRTTWQQYCMNVYGTARVCATTSCSFFATKVWPGLSVERVVVVQSFSAFRFDNSSHHRKREREREREQIPERQRESGACSEYFSHFGQSFNTLFLSHFCSFSIICRF